ncbi:galactokinase [Candidatus Avelusimicrobium fimicolum]|uniref:galactokinase n=1 Tax=Candidatus Avelusimicrobium TaxID=2840538 RepID=UPI002A894420|nr:galactokinase [Spirochaetia bacterium]MDY3910775.1 galactokinase [Elusimicrobiaceae bacterium]
MNQLALRSKFNEVFKKEKLYFFAPGRVNLIGEHTDYNGGHVFPCALSFGTHCVFCKRDDKKVRLYSLNFPEKGIIDADLSAISYDKKQDWANYPLGVIKTLQNHGYNINQGFELMFWGDIPNGAGLSSSASIELATAVAMNKVFNLYIPQVELVKFCQEAENKFVGMNCGIMDQFAIGMGKEGCAVLLDCNTLNYEYAPLDLKGVSIVIMNTNKRRELADSKYNERRSECERALKELQRKLPIKSLGDLSIDEFEKNKELITNPTDRKRAKHAVYENQRTLQAVERLKAGDLKTFGKLMNESHISLRDDYEVTGKELDTLAEAAWQQPGVLGARMTGAGFGGCAIALVQDADVKHFIDNVGKIYREKTGLQADFYIASVGGPARQEEKMY